MPDKLKKLEAVIGLIERDNPSMEEVADVVKLILEKIELVKAELNKCMSDMGEDMSEKHEEMSEEMNEMEEAHQRLSRLIVEIKDQSTANYDSLAKEIYKELKRVEDLIPEVKDWAFLENKIAELESKIPTIPEPINGDETINLINSAQNQINKERIEGLMEELQSIRAMVSARPVGVGSGGARYVNIPMVDNFTSQTDGATKQFYLSKAPKNLETMKLWGSDFPHIMTHGNGFTVSGKLLTLASDVDAPTLGAILVTEYYV